MRGCDVAFYHITLNTCSYICPHQAVRVLYADDVARGSTEARLLLLTGVDITRRLARL